MPPPHIQIHTRPLTIVAHQLWAEAVSPGDVVLDATAGNGHDTLVLANLCGVSGRVVAMDLQPQALESASARLQHAGMDKQVVLLLGDHARLEEIAGKHAPKGFALVVFNLGYLPGGDKEITTTASGTKAALDQAFRLLRPGGALSVLCYPGHDEGRQERDAVEAWALPLECAEARWHRAPADRKNAPQLLFLKK